MTFDEILEQVIALLKRQGRLSYRALKVRFDIDDAYLEALKEEILYVHESSVEADDRGLTWTGETADTQVKATGQPNQPNPQSTTQEAQPTQTETLPLEPSTPDAERRQLTVMFCDLSDSTRLSGQLDPEDLRDVIRAYQSTSAEVIERYDGYIAQHLGDGLMVYFGWPRAHEDDAQRAVYAGLGILETMQTLNTQLEQDKGVHLAVRIGIHTGLVVVGEIGKGASQEHLALGETPNVASRIEGVAEPNTVAISAATYQLVQGYFDCVELGLHTLKGVDEPQQVYRVMGAGELPSRFMAATTMGLTALVGREEEIALLRKRWAQATAGEGQVVLLSGEAGIGKSRITQALREQIADETHLDMHYQCSPYHTNTAFYPITEQFALAAGFTRQDTPDEKLDKLEAHLQQIGLAIPEVAPLFADALSLATAGRYPTLDITPQRQKERTIDALANRLLTAAQHQPVLFIAEDLHWSDPSSLETIGRIIEQLADARVLMVCTYRPSFDVPWGLDGPITTLSLNRLSRSQTASLICNVTAGKPFPHDVVEQIVAKSDGVPLYVEELTKHVLESGWLDDKEDHYELKGALPPIAIPVTLRDALTARLDRLPEAREVAQLGAVLGREFAYHMLRSLTMLDEGTLQARLMQLVEAKLVYQRGHPPQASYVFKHALIQDAAYQSLLRRTRQDYHQRIAQVLTEHFPEMIETQPELLAHHYTEAGLGVQAISYWLRAGQRGIERSANVEAISHLTSGLKLLKALPETIESTWQELELQIALGPALMAVKGWGAPEVEQAYIRARELCQQVGETPQLFSVLWGLWGFYQMRGDLLIAQEVGEQLLDLVQPVQDLALLLLAHNVLGDNAIWLGEFASAREHMEEGIALYDSEQHHSLAIRYGGFDPGLHSRYHAAFALWALGYPDQAMKKRHDALTLARELSHPHSWASTAAHVAMFHSLRREWQAAQELAEAGIALSSKHGFSLWGAWGTIHWGWALAEQGRIEEGIAQMRHGLATWRATGTELIRPYFLSLLAEAYWKGGPADEGLGAIDEALAMVQKHQETFCEAELYRLKGELLLSSSAGNEAEAEACFYHALSVARHQQAKSWELRAATSLARLWQSQGKRQEAYDLLAPVYEWFTEGFDTADLQEAKALLAELCIPP